MSHRDVAVVALGRFLAVERYCETCLPPSTDQRGYEDKPGTRSIALAAVRSQARRRRASLPGWTSY
jgi:hypothetical protein